MKKIISLSLHFLILLSLYSCCKKVKCPEILNSEKEWLPYAEGDSLVFKNFENDALISYKVSFVNEAYNYRNEGIYRCNNKCGSVYNIKLYGLDYPKNQDYFITKTSSIFNVAGGSVPMPWEQSSNRFNYFYFNESIKLDTITIGGELLSDVYKFAAENPVDPVGQSKIAETYIKKGRGIVKFTLFNNESFELIKHVKL